MSIKKFQQPNYQPYKPFVLKKHHKWMIGGISAVVVIYMIVSIIIISGLTVKQTLDSNQLTNDINKLQADTQNKLNELTENILLVEKDIQQTKKNLTNIETIREEFNLLKASTGEDFSGIIENSVKAVVTIKTDIGQGTGFIITPDGYVVTNAHLLSGGKTIESTNYEKNKISTELVGYNAEMDIALLKINGEYDFLSLGNSDETQVGERVIAIGNPLGLQFSVTEGIVSGIHRPGINELEAYTQTDAALNPGNSGGPLINKNGKVIGINNFKLGSGESLGFALESNYIKDAVNAISLEKLQKEILS
ncbi:MAG: trypsin-like peptidase domain-containing protein [Nanoarchaeota archaeon]